MQRYNLERDYGASCDCSIERADDGFYVMFDDHQAALSALEEENRRLRKALHDISVVGLLSDEKDSPRAKRMREIAEEALKK